MEAVIKLVLSDSLKWCSSTDVDYWIFFIIPAVINGGDNLSGTLMILQSVILLRIPLSVSGSTLYRQARRRLLVSGF